jgi:amidohydrolase
MASVDNWRVTFTGKGGHGAMPHTAIDPTIAAANFIGSLQTITSRELNPTDTAVISVGTLTSGSAFNIIPGKAVMGGTLRSFSPEVRGAMEERMRRIADGIAYAFRCKAETVVEYMHPSVVNHGDVTKLLKESAEKVVGPENVEESPLLMVSEDFSLYLERVPGTFFFLGAGSAEKGTDFPHHSPRFDIDDDALPIGISLMTAFAAAALETQTDRAAVSL